MGLTFITGGQCEAIRVTPIALTAAAAMIGASVLFIYPIFERRAISLLFELFSSTLLILLAIPSNYATLRDDGMALSQEARSNRLNFPNWAPTILQHISLVGSMAGSSTDTESSVASAIAAAIRAGPLVTRQRMSEPDHQTVRSLPLSLTGKLT